MGKFGNGCDQAWTCERQEKKSLVILIIFEKLLHSRLVSSGSSLSEALDIRDGEALSARLSARIKAAKVFLEKSLGFVFNSFS